MTDLSTARHQLTHVNGIRIHSVELGPEQGPMVLFVHGFPESWYSWRHQLPALAEAGYRAVALDVRGYGRSSTPSAIEDYRMVRHVADNVALVRALGAETAVVVGHDWGAPIAWTSAQLRPDVFTAVAGLSVPFAPSGPTRPTDGFRALGGDEEFYINYFQEPGRAEAEIEADVRRWLLGMYYTSSGEGGLVAKNAGFTGIASVAPGGRMSDRFVWPETMPEWMSEDDLDLYAAEFERGGFAGPLNRYRNVDRDWEDLAAFGDRPIEVPALFVGGQFDGPTVWGRRSIDRFERTLPRLRGSHILPGCGHWVQQERAKEVNDLLLEFLGTLG